MRHRERIASRAGHADGRPETFLAFHCPQLLTLVPEQRTVLPEGSFQELRIDHRAALGCE